MNEYRFRLRTTQAEFRFHAGVWLQSGHGVIHLTRLMEKIVLLFLDSPLIELSADSIQERVTGPPVNAQDPTAYRKHIAAINHAFGFVLLTTRLNVGVRSGGAKSRRASYRLSADVEILKRHYDENPSHESPAASLAGAGAPVNESAPPQLRSFFEHLIAHHTALFAGREAALAAIQSFVTSGTSGYLLVEGLSGYGKTTLLAALVHKNPRFAYHFISQTYKAHGAIFDPTALQAMLFSLCEQMRPEGARLDSVSEALSVWHAQLRASPAQTPTVLVIDGVDEVDRHPNHLYGLFPERLPAGVFIILSARTIGDRDYLVEIGLPTRSVQHRLRLEGLDEAALREMMVMAGGVASALETSAEFVSRLHHVSSGDPFYLRFLVEDVAAGRIARNNVDLVPSGLEAYLDKQLEILDRSAHLQQQRDIIGVVLDAYGPIPRVELIDMVPGLDRLNFRRIIKDIQRFLLEHNDAFTICHNRFRDYFSRRR